jgi:hypothetical protein
LLAHGQWVSPGTPVSYTTKTGRHDIAEILLKVALNTINYIKSKVKAQKRHEMVTKTLHRTRSIKQHEHN